MPQTAIKRIDPALAEYIQDCVFPQYSKNDKGHQLSHIKYVIRRSLSFMDQFENLNVNIVYAAAAYHDIAHHIDKDRHETLSAKAFLDDAVMERFFTDIERKTIAEAIEDHRASLESLPRSDYGRVISSADRSTDLDGFLRRTHAYSLKHFPEYTEEQNIERCYQHMQSKYGEDGYAKHYVEDAEYIQFCREIREFLADKEAFAHKYREIMSSAERDQD